MKRQRHSKDEIRRKLSRASAALAEGATIPELCRTLEISEATFHRWRKRFDVVQTRTVVRKRESASDPAERAHELERENRRLKLLVGELMLEIAFLKDTVQGKPPR